MTHARDRGDAYGREALERAAEEERGGPDPDWSGAPEMAGLGEQRSWEAWSPEEDLHERLVGEPPAPDAVEGESADALICGEIQQRLDGHRSLDTGGVRVSVAAGAVVLDGLVEDPETRRVVERLVADTPGVRDMVNHLDVRSRATR